MAEKTNQARARARRLADPDAYRKCGECSRCTTGIGRDRDPGATDCYAAMIDAALRPTRRSA